MDKIIDKVMVELKRIFDNRGSMHIDDATQIAGSMSPHIALRKRVAVEVLKEIEAQTGSVTDAELRALWAELKR